MPVDVVFVDDEPMLLAGLRRGLRSMARQWTMRFADSGTSALEQLGQRPADVVVSDVRMPGMDGVELLSRVRDLYPGTLRVALSGQTELEQALAAVSVTHRFLHKPCRADMLQTTVSELIEIRKRITSPEMQTFVTHTGALPASPMVVDQLNTVLLDSTATSTAIAEAVSADPAITARVLELANSVLLDAGKPAYDLPAAVTVLGAPLIRNLATATAAREAFTSASTALSTMAAELEHHSLAVARLAARISGEQHNGPAYSAGILHDIGLLVLASQAPDHWADISDRIAAGASRLDAEKAVLGITHAQIGSHLLAFWGLPTRLYEAVAWHHDAPTHSSWTMGAVHAVFLAEALLIRLAADPGAGTEVLNDLDPAYLAALQVTDRLGDLVDAALDLIVTAGGGGE